MKKFKAVSLVNVALICALSIMFAACHKSDEDSEQIEKVRAILNDDNIVLLKDYDGREYYRPGYSGPISDGVLFKQGITYQMTGFFTADMPLEIFEINWYIANDKADEAEAKLIGSAYYRNKKMIALSQTFDSSQESVILELIKKGLENSDKTQTN